MPIQTTYEDTIAKAFVGMIANMEPKRLISRNVETAAGIGFGLPVAQGAEDRDCIATEGGVTKILGITVLDRSVTAEFPNGFAQYESARIMTSGCVWVTASVDVVAGDPVHVTVATGAFTKSGGVQIVGARWDTSATSGGLAVVRLVD